MADVLVPIMKIAMKDFLETMMAVDLMQETLTEVFEESIVESEGYVPITVESLGLNLFFDYQFEDNFRIMQRYLQIALNGTMITDKKNYSKPSIREIDMPYHNRLSPAKVQMFVSEYIF